MAQTTGTRFTFNNVPLQAETLYLDATTTVRAVAPLVAEFGALGSAVQDAGINIGALAQALQSMKDAAAADRSTADKRLSMAALRAELRPLDIVQVAPGQYRGGVLPLTMMRSDGSRLSGEVCDSDLAEPEPFARLKKSILVVQPQWRDLMLERLHRFGVERIVSAQSNGWNCNYRLAFKDGHELDIKIWLPGIAETGLLEYVEAEVIAWRGIQVGEPLVKREIEAVAVVPFTNRARRTL